MKKRLQDDEQKTNAAFSPPSIRRGLRGHKAFSKQAFLDLGLIHNSSEVDHFLKEHVKNVWELGDEIRMRLLSGIGSAFDLAMNNPAGMVAMVEAVEVYEIAAEDYKAVHGVEAGSNQNLRFTDMRSSALSSLFKDMETRGLDVFKDITMQVSRGWILWRNSLLPHRNSLTLLFIFRLQMLPKKKMQKINSFLLSFAPPENLRRRLGL